MRATRRAVRWLGIALLGLAGCQTTKPSARPVVAEEVVMPPVEDARFSQAPTYPKEVMGAGRFSTTPNTSIAGPRTPRLGAGGAGMGGISPAGF